jgi:hypothetical protein
MSTTLRAEFFFDDEANTWHYRVPALHINGGGTATREDAQLECMDVIAFALEGDPSEYDSRPPPYGGGQRAIDSAPRRPLTITTEG